MKAVFKHELSSYFTGLSAYIFGAFMLLFIGIYTMVFNITGQYTNYELSVGNLGFIYLLIIPILTMRIVAEEKKQKTDQLLYSLPISMTDVIIGKYLALIMVILPPILILSIYPLILKRFGNVYFPVAFGSVLAFFLLGATLVAIGMFISSLCENPVVSAGVCFGVMLLLYFLSSLSTFVSSSSKKSFIAFTVIVLILMAIIWFMTKSTLTMFTVGLVFEAILFGLFVKNEQFFEGLFPEVMRKLSLYDRFYIFIDGVFDVTGVVYYLSIIVVFLFLSIEALEKRRWS